jgi:aryl-alcohol dehydrogenase-like predicted oxidoreductase
LNTDYIDVYQLHNPPMRLINQESTYAIFNTLKREGKIRAWGLSIFDPIAGLTALKVGQPDSLQVAYNIFHSRASDILLPAAYQSGCAIIVREPLANGFLSGKYDSSFEFERGDIREQWRQDYINARVTAAKQLVSLAKAGVRTLAQASIAYALTPEAVSVVIPGIKTPQQALEYLATSQTPPLTAEEQAFIKELQKKSFGL